MRRSLARNRILQNQIFIPVFSILIGLSLSSCEGDQDRDLTNLERQELSVLYTDSVRVLTSRMDSLCAANLASEVQRLADSLVELRLRDIENQLNNSFTGQ